MFLLSDQPQVSLILIRQLIERYSINRFPITAPMVAGQRGNPVLFDKITFGSLMQVQGDRGGRAVFDKFPVDWLPWIDDRTLMDVDQEGDESALMDVFFPLES
jgi:molybdenum cofactor cytidylyltransferase